MYHVPLAFQCIYRLSLHRDERGENGEKEGREWRLPDFMYADDLVLCGELKEDLRVIVGHFVEVCRLSLKVNACKSKVMVLSEKEGLECEVCVDGL